MGPHLIRTTSLLAAAAGVALLARAFAEPHILGTPLGAPPAFTADAQPTVCIPELTDASLSSVGAASTGGLTHDCACPAKRRFAIAADPPASSNVNAVDGPSGELAADETGFEVVRASVAGHGTVDVVGQPAVSVDKRVLAIIARELAFPRSLRRGTSIEAVYRKQNGRADVVAVTIGAGATARRAFYFRSPGNSAEGFFARDGKSLEFRFLRYPLAFDVVSSPFSSARFHPILSARRPHNGVDFAARPGTPVLAVGSGIVKEATWDGRFGRTVAVQHEGGYVSRYSHLQGFASGVRAGVKVRKGQVVGFVGSSGLATGPHLHFAMIKNGAYIDPLGANFPKRASLDTKSLDQFRSTVARVERAMATAADERRAQIAAHTPSTGRSARRGG